MSISGFHAFRIVETFTLGGLKKRLLTNVHDATKHTFHVIYVIL